MSTNVRVWSGTCAVIAFGLAVTLFAQTPQSSQTSSAKNITVTGCIERAAEAPTGTTGTAGATTPSMDKTKFVLTNAALSTAAATGTAGTSEAATNVAPKYRLDADDAKLSSHVGHKVEISGTVAEQPSTSTTSQPPSASSNENPPKLKVDTVRMIASSCPN